ncbi:MAG: hypothetical protein GY795_11135 [Desulfobacterales bacterium]|nr:hypothetical protein [Desulfobacterales bacterium]
MSDDIFTRDIATWRPKTFNDESRSVRVIAVTENPVRVWDWERKDFVTEVLLIDGVHLPPSRQIPLLDSHDRSSVSRVLGSARNFKPAGTSLECDVFFSGTDSGKETAQKVKEGHLTDFSVGYSSIESYWIPEGEVQSVNGRTFRGPVRITSKWNLKELSITPIGADQQATVRIWNGDVYAETPAQQPSAGAGAIAHIPQTQLPDKAADTEDTPPQTPEPEPASEAENIAHTPEQTDVTRNNDDLTPVPAPAALKPETDNVLQPPEQAAETWDCPDLSPSLNPVPEPETDSWDIPNIPQPNIPQPTTPDETTEYRDYPEPLQTPAPEKEETTRSEPDIFQRLFLQKRELTVADIIFIVCAFLMVSFLLKGLLE